MNTAKKESCRKAKSINNAEKSYPGAAFDNAEGNDATAKEVKDYTKSINNNPRNTGN